MTNYVLNTINFLKELLSTKDLIIESYEFSDSADEYDIDHYFNRKTLYFNRNTNVLTALCPLNSSQLKFHKEIIKIESNENFRWVLKSQIKKYFFYRKGCAMITIFDKNKVFNTTRFF